MAKRIVYVDPDTENLCVVVPSYDSIDQGFFADEAELLAHCVARSVPDGVAHRVVEHTVIPSSRLFRNAWADDGAAVDVDMAKARTMHMDSIRGERNKKLVEMDVTFMRAVEDNDTDAQDAASTAKQALRDIPATFDLSPHANPDDLNAAWPDGLPRPPEE
tara:strand:- start:828 stop:1310 length:483 start_codon:yes stop_codon:yes gene_type:complete